jgi:hypothetical protein
VLDGCFDVVVDADRGQQSVRAALVDPESHLGRQVMAAPAYTPAKKLSLASVMGRNPHSRPKTVPGDRPEAEAA